jgi:transcriptional regulator with XRE-family HTH domain
MNSVDEALRRARTGARIRELRLARDIKAVDLAAQVGCSDGHIHNIESGRSRATDETRLAIAAALGVPLAEIDLEEVAS